MMNYLYQLLRCQHATPVYNGQQTMALYRCTRWWHPWGEHK